MKLLRYFSNLLSNKKGFTLVELLVVIGVLGVLATGLVLIINPGEQTARARDAERKSDLAQIQRALEMYYDDFGKYPDVVKFGDEWEPYMTKVPQDKRSSQQYQYKTESSNQKYFLYAHLEAAKDNQACNNGDVQQECSEASGLDCGSGLVCNYGVSSPNATP